MTFVSDWVKQNRGPIRKCSESNCTGSVYFCRTYFSGDADWQVCQCDKCGAGWESAGVWSYPIDQKIKQEPTEAKTLPIVQLIGGPLDGQSHQLEDPFDMGVWPEKMGLPVNGNKDDLAWYSKSEGNVYVYGKGA